MQNECPEEMRTWANTTTLDAAQQERASARLNRLTGDARLRDSCWDHNSCGGARNDKADSWIYSVMPVDGDRLIAGPSFPCGCVRHEKGNGDVGVARKP